MRSGPPDRQFDFSACCELVAVAKRLSAPGTGVGLPEPMEVERQDQAHPSRALRAELGRR